MIVREMLSSSSRLIGAISIPEPPGTSLNSITMYNHMARALPRKNLTGTLYKEAADSIRKLHNTSHGLSIVRKWHYLNNIGGVAYDLVVRPTKILCKIKQRHLRLASDKHGSTACVIYVLECGRVDNIRRFALVIRFVAKAKASVTARGSPMVDRETS